MNQTYGLSSIGLLALHDPRDRLSLLRPDYFEIDQTNGMNYNNLKKKASRYRQILDNTVNYRKAWKDGLKEMIEKQLKEIIQEAQLQATVELKEDLNNLSAIVLNLGTGFSGITEDTGQVERPFLKSNGMLIYQQLFNGKIMVSMTHPLIEGLGKPSAPKQIEILRPEELKPPFIVRHTEEFLKEIIEWEDYDDDMPQSQPIGFQTGFQRGVIQQNDQ